MDATPSAGVVRKRPTRRAKRKPSIWDDVLRWLGFSLFVSLVPFGFAWLVVYPKNRAVFEWFMLWENGELALVSALLAASAVGDLIRPKLRHLKTALFAGTAAVATAFLGSFLFALLRGGGSGLSHGEITGLQLTLLAFAFAVGFGCKLIAGLSEG